MRNEDCVFCKIVKGEIPAERVYEDEEMIGFLDANPVNPGHTLVIPKEHHAKMEEVPDGLLGGMFAKSKKLMGQIKKATNADYVVVSVVGVDVPHFHIHLIPRYFDDGMANFWPTKKYKNKEAEIIAEKIKKEL